MKKISVLLTLVGLAGLLLTLSLPVQLVKADGGALGRGDILDMDASTQSQAHPDVAWNEACDKFLVVYDRKGTDVDDNIWGRYVNGDGLARGAGPFQIAAADLQQQRPAVAYNPGGGNFVVVWQDYRNLEWEIWAQFVGCEKNRIGEPIQITPGHDPVVGPLGNVIGQEMAHYQLNPDVACGYGNGFLSGCWVVWEDFRNGNWDIYAQKLTSGGALDGDNIQLTSSSAWQHNPAITHNPEPTGCADLGSFMVVWDDMRNAHKGYATDIYAQQLDWGNRCGGNMPVRTGSGEQRFPDIAYGTINDRYQVVWEDNRAADWDVYARLITPHGGIAGDDFALARIAGSTQGRPRVAYDAEFIDEFTTVWHDYRRGAGPDIASQRTSGTGERMGANIPIVAAGTSELYPAIAFGDTSNHYLVAWQDSANGILARAVWR